MDFETAQVSLIGDRPENQDRAEILIRDEGVLAIVADGMGGHRDGALAAETAITHLESAFRDARRKRPEPEKFLSETIASAHAEVLALGAGMPLDVRPGTIIVCALILGTEMWWAHVGDSRAYHLRAGKLLVRTRDHTEIEELLEAGKITLRQAETHPGRHMVEHCLGVSPETPPMAVSEAMKLADGDTVLLCSDGFWSQTEEASLLTALSRQTDLQALVEALAENAAKAGSPHSDNVTAIALRMHVGEETQ
ncbi:MAG: PP2C family protein-serine/threonine phosphatase [Gammaproteobacteria bacterium]